jgi:hypothetical protein
MHRHARGADLMDDEKPSTTSMLTQRAQSRLAEIRADISTRLWPVNAGMSAADFNVLMDQMSRLQLNFELRAAANISDQIDTRAGERDRRRFPPVPPLDEITVEKPPPE